MEYALILAAVAALIVIVVLAFGGTVKGLFTTGSSCIGAGASSTC